VPIQRHACRRFPAMIRQASLLDRSQTELGRDNTLPRPSAMSPEPVLVVIPCLNEEDHIQRVVTKMAAEQRSVNAKIVVVDGGSTDQTRAIVKRLAESNPQIELMRNSKGIQAAAVNDAVRKYGRGARFLIRIDAHADYPDRYCERLLKVQARTQADSVVVSMHAEGHKCFQRAASTAQNSILGNGGSAHRNETTSCWVDHGHHALMTINAFGAVGGYDEAFSHNEDAELDARLTAEGFHIYLTGEAQVRYYPRATVSALFQQYFNIGKGRARNFLKHRKNAKLRHLMLAGVAPAVCLFLLTPFSVIFALPALAWALLCVGYGVVLGMRLRDACAAAAGIAAIAMQAGWSFGFFAGLKVELSRVDTAGPKDADRETLKSGRMPQ
jgi:succinoglycan biosynthesis protein ExoA